MGYSKEKAVKIEDFKSKYMPAGINENCSLVSASVKLSPTGKPILQIDFTNEEGQMLSHTEWEPRMGGFIDTPEKLDDNMNKQYRRMLEIMLCFYKDEEIDFNGEKFIDFANYVADKLNNANKDIKLRIKVVYNKDGYTTLPNSVSRKFIEPMSITKENSEITIDSKYDLVTRPVIANKETTVENPFSNPTTTQEVNINNDDLPF